MDEIIRFIKKILMQIILYPLRVLKVDNNKVLLINNLALKYSGNPKYIAECLYGKYPDQFEIVFAVSNPKNYVELESNSRHFIKFNSFQYFIAAMTCKVFITNSGGYSYIPLRKIQYVIDTTHGGGAYKKNGLDMFENTWLFRKDLMMSSKKTNVVLSTCRLATVSNTRSCMIPMEKYWEIGMPRNDVLINGDDKVQKEVKKKIGLSKNDKFVLFCPTYRKPDDNHFKNSVAVSYGIDSKRTCDALSERFGGNWKFGIRLHPRIVNEYSIDDGNIINLTDYEEMQELLLAADVMINDFSSSMWDFMLTGKPCFTFAIDLEHYIKTTEVYSPVEDWPFPKSTNNDQLVKSILEFDEIHYAEECKRHYTDLGGCESGRATQLVCERIFDISRGKYTF